MLGMNVIQHTECLLSTVYKGKKLHFNRIVEWVKYIGITSLSSTNVKKIVSIGIDLKYRNTLSIHLCGRYDVFLVWWMKKRLNIPIAGVYKINDLAIQWLKNQDSLF